ncbi:TPA: E3 ubiquitin-protein ligase smurf2 [Trebouxia sp. C0006]
MLEVEGLLNGANWQGLVQGALQALRGSRHMAMWVPRQDMLEDMCHGFVGGTGFASDISAGLEVQFLNESGIGSGVRRDWLNSMMASMLDPQTGLFEAADGGHTWQPCPLAHMQDQHVVYFEMLGRAMGMALLHGEVLPGAHFTPNFLKLLLGQPAKLDDLRGNPPLLTFLKQLAAGQFKPEELCLTFSCANGLGPEADLIPEGSQVEVDSTNWQDYYKHMVAFKLHKSIQREVEAVKKGLQHFVDERTMKLLHRYATPQILDQLLAGESGVDVEDWQAYTLYKNCSEHNHVVKWFWEILQGYSQKQLQALLAFVTCSPVPPAGGFARLAGFNGGRHLFELCLLPEHDDSRLPRAATCFNTLYLPSYSSKQVMHHRLQQASSAQLVFDEGAVHEVAAPRSSTTSRASATSSNSSQRAVNYNANATWVVRQDAFYLPCYSYGEFFVYTCTQ